MKKKGEKDKANEDDSQRKDTITNNKGTVYVFLIISSKFHSLSVCIVKSFCGDHQSLRYSCGGIGWMIF